MKKMIRILGMASILFGIAGFTAAIADSAVSGTSARFAEYDDTDPMQVEEEDSLGEDVIQEAGEIPQEEFIHEEEDAPFTEDEDYEEMDPKSTAEEPEETQQ